MKAGATVTTKHFFPTVCGSIIYQGFHLSLAISPFILSIVWTFNPCSCSLTFDFTWFLPFCIQSPLISFFYLPSHINSLQILLLFPLQDPCQEPSLAICPGEWWYCSALFWMLNCAAAAAISMLAKKPQKPPNNNQNPGEEKPFSASQRSDTFSHMHINSRITSPILYFSILSS